MGIWLSANNAAPEKKRNKFEKLLRNKYVEWELPESTTQEFQNRRKPERNAWLIARFGQMESEQERFTHTMDLLELEVSGLEQHEDLALVDRVSKLVGEISGRITEAENKCECAYVVLAALWLRWCGILMLAA